MPVPVVVERAPPTVGVSGGPLPRLMLLVTVQSLSTTPFQPLTGAEARRVPTPLLYCQFKLAACVRLPAERARSAEVSR